MSDDATLDEFIKDTSHCLDLGPRSLDLPDQWSKTEFRNTFSYQRGVNYSSDNYVSEGEGMVFLTMNAIAPGGGLKKDSLKFYDDDIPDSKTTTEGDILMANTDLSQDGEIIGYPVRVPAFDTSVEKCFSHHLLKIQQAQRRYDSHFLEYLLSAKYIHDRMIAFSCGSTVLNLNTDLLESLEIPVPPLSEQRKIATVLHTVDQAIQKTEQIIEQTKRYKSGLKQDIFRGGIGDNATKELPAIGEIPECWDITTLEDVSEWITDGTHTPYDAKQEGFPCLTGKNIRDYGFNLDDIKLVSEKAFEEMRSRVSPEQGDVLFVKDGSIGYTQVNDLQFEFGLLESVLLIRTNKNKIRPHYLQQLLTWKPFRELLISRRVGTGIERMTISGMKKAEVILPSLEEQNEIENILLQVDKYIDNESKYLSRLKRFKRGLMQDLLSGEVRTTDTDIDILEEVAKYG